MASGTELKNYKTNIETAFNNKYSDFNITVFRDLGEDFELPAIVINKPVLEPNQAAQTTSRFRVQVQTNVFVIYSAADESNDIECIQKSANIAKFINANCFGEKFPARVSLIEPVIEEGLEEYFMQRIDFEQNIEVTEDN